MWNKSLLSTLWSLWGITFSQLPLSPTVHYEITLVIMLLSPLTLWASGGFWVVATVLIIQNSLAALFSFFPLLDDFLGKLLGLLHSYLENNFLHRSFALAFSALCRGKKISCVILCGRIKRGWDLGVLGGGGGNSTKRGEKCSIIF